MKTENEKKYGEKKADVIEKWFEIWESLGTGACLLNADKYLKRFFSESTEKSHNEADIIKATDYLYRLHEKGILSEQELRDLRYLISRYHFDSARIYLHDIGSKYAEFHDFHSIVERNYQSIVKRGLITPKTGFRDFFEKLFEEVQEFENELFDNEAFEFHDEISEIPFQIAKKDRVSEELADIILVCLNFARHYDIDILSEINNKIKKNEKRKKN